MILKQYTVTGMSCAACSARVEKAVGAVDGVSSCSVNLLTGSLAVEGTADEKKIIDAVVKAGYGAKAKGGSTETKKDDDELKDTETPALKKRLFTSLGFLLVLMYFSMGHSMLSLPLPSFFHNNYIAIGLVQLILTIAVMFINKSFFINGVKGVLHKAPNMDTLVALGSGASFVWSTYVLFEMTGAVDDTQKLMELMHEFYFESAAMILVLITVGKLLEAKSKGRTTDALKSLLKLKPKTANIIKDAQEITVEASSVQKGDIFVVRPGENIPVDGKIIEGHSAVNEAALTGESTPCDKSIGDTVSTGTVNQSGFLKCEATAVGEDTTLSQIIAMVSDAAATKAPIAKIADKVSGVFVPIVVTIAIITTVVWLLAGESAAFALARGISVLVISCPCALGLATPVAIMVGSGMGAKNSILYKTAESIETAGKIQIVVLDKTGTITKGEPEVTDIIPADGVSAGELLQLSFSLESKSEHPLGKAVVQKAQSENIFALSVDDFSIIPGKGLSGIIEGENVYGGNLKFIEEICTVPHSAKEKGAENANEGKTPLYFCKGGKFLGTVVVCDVIKEDSAKAIAQLKNMGIYVVMLTGDNPNTANAIGKIAGVDEVIAGVLPEGKEKAIRSLQKKGKVAMVGDGINDAVALTRADVGIAIGAGTDVAIDAADVVLMKSSLMDVPALLRLSRSTLKIIHQNLFWAFFYNVLGIPLAAGAYIPIFGWVLNPMFGAAAMSLSSFCVVSNALRLNLVNIRNSKHDRKIKRKIEAVSSADEENEMTIKVEGMMCAHCESRVKTCLENIDGIELADASFETGTVKMIVSSSVDMKLIKAEIKKAGYKVK